MVLIRFYHDSSLLNLPVTSINAGAFDDRYCDSERVHMAEVPERIGEL